MNALIRILSCLLLAAAFSAPVLAIAQEAQSQETQAQRQKTQPMNNAPVWRAVRSGDEQYTSVKGRETGVLIQSQGETWRQIRNGPVSIIGGWALVLMVLVIGGYFSWKGTMRLHSEPTGKKIRRFSPWERLIHWSTAISFSLLGITGLIILLGKHVLLPVIGYTLFSWLTQLSKIIHNFIGPLFILCAICLFITFVKDNIPRASDWIWVKKFGGLFADEHVPSHRFNAGEKAWFWGGLSVLGLVVGASGLVLDFPNFDQTRSTMQIANIVHAVGALLFILGSLGHIYMGTLGVEGAYEAMRTGYADEAWIREHHEYWYDDVKSGKIAVDTSPQEAAPGSGARPQAQG